MRYSVNSRTAQWRLVDDEAVIVNVESSHYYSLNRSGTIAWTALAQTARSADELTQLVAAAYAIDERQARADVDALLDALRSEDLIVES